MSACIIHIEETASTNTDAMARALRGEALPFWLMADRQTAGKGRLGRTWVSEAANFHASYGGRVECPLDTAPQLSLVAGVAVMDALRHLIPLVASAGADTIALKWPNDIMAQDAKCGGILVETARDSVNGSMIAVIGIGLNLVSHPVIDGRRTTHLANLGSYAPPLAYLSAIATSMEKVLQDWNGGAGFEGIRARWLEAAAPAGTAMVVNTGQARAEGTFAGLDSDGALLMRDKMGRVQRFTFGDVTLL